ncbi:FkbM family methyltransferase [Parabacteroides sp. PF5-9]|uniref:FkbM family methyltransferase n=1 Tax=Parabacteroides sp. PF5-9 TaxID=1742404 RepID=UPI00247641D0|nr:FkbM family methyltransferase [Parabacteroides sp. PF5-9]MDH6358705.1 hypothetical protein [Parabacteroides sp. PF5-9]
MITKLYRKITPVAFRKFIYRLFLGKILQRTRMIKQHKLAKEIVAYYNLPENRNNYPQEYIEAAKWIELHGFAMFPYDYTSEYKQRQPQVFNCQESKLKYILHQGKKLYFPKNFSNKDCQRYYNELTMEQDPRSPHQYNYSCFKQGNEWIILDVGTAEGIFALSVIDYAEKIYLFECDERWLEALSMTFKPFQDKIEIVHKYVSDTDTESTITINTFLSDKTFQKCYLKMDIEGAELLALTGGDAFLNDSKKMNISVCAYHLDEIGEQINAYLTARGFNCVYTNGVMTFGTEAPYFRKGVIYAQNFSENVDA